MSFNIRDIIADIENRLSLIENLHASPSYQVEPDPVPEKAPKQPQVTFRQLEELRSLVLDLQNRLNLHLDKQKKPRKDIL